MTSLLLLALSTLPAHAELHGTGHYDVDIVPILVPEAQAQALLPEGLELIDESRPGVPAGQRLVVLTLGHQSDVEPATRAFPLPVFSWDYAELTAAVPFVRIAGGDGQVFHHIFRLYLDHHRAILAGRPYGFPKLYAAIHTGTADFGPRVVRNYDVASDRDGTRILRGTFSHPTAAAELPLSAMPNFEVVSEVFSRESVPMIQKGPGGHWVCSSFLWDTEHATGFPVEATIEAHLSDIGLEGTFRTAGLDHAIWGAFRTSVDWEISTPRPCR
jgi:hypothetical protein